MRNQPRPRTTPSLFLTVATIVVTVVPTLALLLCAALYLRQLGRYLAPRLAPLVAEAASATLHREVGIDRIQVFERPGVIVVDGISVSNGPTFKMSRGLAVARIPEAVISYDLPALLRTPANATMTIRTVALTRPSLFIEQLAPGKFNFSSLIKPPNPAKPFPFRGKVLVQNGTLVVRDDNAPHLLGAQQNSFTHVTGTADLTTPGRIAFLASAHGAANRFTSVILRGNVLDPALQAPPSTVRGFSLRVQVAHGNAPYLTNYFAPFLVKTVRVSQGVGDADITIAQFGTTKSGPMSVLGSAFVSGGEAALTNRSLLLRPLTDVHARLTFSTTDLSVDGTTTVAGVPLAVHGALLDFRHPHAALAISSSAVTYAGLKSALTVIPPLPKGLTIPATAMADTLITGDLRHPHVAVNARLSALSYGGAMFHAISASGDFQDGLLRVTRLEALEPETGGSLDLTGYLRTQAKPLTYGIAGNVARVNLSALPLPSALKRAIGPVLGTGSAQFQASDLGVQADIAVTQASIHHLAIDSLAGRVIWKAGRPVILHKFTAHVAGGIVYADGQLPFGDPSTRTWNLSVQAAQIGLGRFVHPFVKLPIGGQLYFFGHLQGPGAVPLLMGKLTVLVPHYGNYVADQLQGTFSANQNGAQIEKIVIQRFPGSAVIAGSVTQFASGNPALRLHVTVAGAQLADVTRFSTQQHVTASAARAIAAYAPTLTGDVAADLAVTGTVKQPRVAGQVTLTDATYSIFELDHAVAQIAYAGDIVRVSRLAAAGTGIMAQGTGFYDLRTHRIAAHVTSTAEDIGRLLPVSKTSVSITGPISAVADVSGTTETPSVSATLLGKSVSVSGVSLDQISVAARYSQGVFSSGPNGATITLGNAQYIVPEFRYDPRMTGISVLGHVTGETLRHLLVLARGIHGVGSNTQTALLASLSKIPSNADASVDLPVFQVSGTLKDLQAHLVLNARDIRYGPVQLDTIDTEVRYAHGAFDVASLEARGKPNAYLSASGQIDPQGPVNAHGEASGIDLALLNSFIRLPKPIGGQVSDITVVATGATRAPTLAASVTLEHPSYGSVSADGLDSGQISVGNNQIAINGLQIVKDEKTATGQIIEHFASLRGAVPFAWMPGAVLTPTFPVDVPVSLQVSVPPQSLSSIPALFPGVPLTFPTGTISADIGLGGTLARKQITGSVSIVNGSVQSKLLTTQLHDVNLNISLVGDQAKVNLAADSTAGGSILVTGGASLTTGSETETAKLASELVSGIRLNLTATAKNFLVNEPKITQFGNAGFRGKVNGTIVVTQALRSPLVAGNVTLSDVIGVLPSLSETAGAPAPVPVIDPRFQLGVSVAHGSRLRSSLLDAQADGSLAVLGTLSQPNITGDFSIRQGQFFFPTATFRVVPVGTVHIAYVPPNDPVERVNVEARTQISVSDATISANPAGASGPGSFQGPRPIQALQTSRNYTITVTIQGLLNSPNNLNLDFQSDPPGLTQTQILATLGGQQALAGLTQGNVEQGLKTGISQVFTSFAVPLALQPVEKGIANGLGLEDFSVAYSPDAPVQLTFVKRLTPRIGLTYIQMVNSRSTGAVASTLEPPIFQIKLDYSFTDRYRFSLSTDDQHNTIVGVERVYSF